MVKRIDKVRSSSRVHEAYKHYYEKRFISIEQDKDIQEIVTRMQNTKRLIGMLEQSVEELQSEIRQKRGMHEIKIDECIEAATVFDSVQQEVYKNWVSRPWKGKQVKEK
jgi:broad-specificity NMP kinase